QLGHRQSRQGGGRSGRAEPQPHHGLGRDQRARHAAGVPSVKVPKGFFWAGMQAGIKPNRKDLALVYSDTPCSAAGCFTQNLAKAAPVLDAEKRLPAEGIRAVVINSGNANALTGPEGLEDVKTVCEAVAKELEVGAGAVVSASTGVIGVRLPAHKIVSAAPALAASLKADPLLAAEAILTTDTRIKLGTRSVRVGNRDVTLPCICKGSAMMATTLATMIAVVATDCAITPTMLSAALRQAMRRSFNALTVDGDMSTNDCVFALANGKAGNPPIADPGSALDAFSGALDELCQQMAKEIAADGEGATKLLDVSVEGAPTEDAALDLAKACAGSSLVKAAIFGADPNWGRVLASMGARAGTAGYAIDPADARVMMQDVAVYDRAPLAYDASVLKARMREPEVRVTVDLRRGEGKAQAWGCDLPDAGEARRQGRVHRRAAGHQCLRPEGGGDGAHRLHQHRAGDAAQRQRHRSGRRRLGKGRRPHPGAQAGAGRPRPRTGGRGHPGQPRLPGDAAPAGLRAGGLAG